VGRIKGGRELPQLERNKIEDEVDLAERLLNKLEKEDETLTDKLGQLTRKVIKDLEMQYYQPKITKFGESSWDQTFKPRPQDDKQETRAGIDDYFDEVMTIEVVCTKCGKHYAKKLGVREDEEHG
jgi:redox-regulated HSP33 family molecular chaperone